MSHAATAWAGAALLTALFAAPVLRAPGERIFGGETAGRHHDPFTVMRQFAGAAIPSPYLQPATDAPGRALARIVPPVIAYNIVVLLTFPLAAVFAYLLAYELTRSPMASTIAGLAFAFSPFHVAHAAYHPHIAQVQWLPLFLLALWRCLHGFTFSRGMLLVASTALMALANAYGVLVGIVTAALAVPLFWWAPAREGSVRSRRDLLHTTGVLALTGGAAFAILLVVMPSLLDPAAVPVVDRRELFRYSARWWAYLMPPVDHAVLGTWASGIWQEFQIGPGLIEQQLYLGIGLVSLASVALVSAPANLGPWTRATAICLAALAAGALVCSLSPQRTVLGVEVYRPSALLYELLPMFRSYARFGVVVQLCVAVLAGAAAAMLWNRRTAATRGLVVVLLALTVFEYAPLPWRSRDVLPTTAHRWLAANGHVTPVFECAAPAPASGVDAWLAGFPIAYLQPPVPDCDEPGLAGKLRAMGYSHLVITPTGTFVNPSDSDGLRQVYGAGDGAVFELAAPPSSTYVAAMRGWYPREYGEGRDWRWSGGDAAITVMNAGYGGRLLTGSLELWSFGVPRTVTVLMNGVSVGSMQVSTAPAVYPIGPITMLAGRNELTLQAEAAPLAPAALDAASRDQRPLSLAIGNWTVAGKDPQ